MAKGTGGCVQGKARAKARSADLDAIRIRFIERRASPDDILGVIAELAAVRAERDEWKAKYEARMRDPATMTDVEFYGR